MSTMLLSLLIKVREEGAAAIARMRESLVQSADTLRIAKQGGTALAIGLGVGTVEAVRLGQAIGNARNEGRALIGTLLHGSLGVGAAVYTFKKSFLDIAISAEQARSRMLAIEETPGRAEAAMAWTKAFRKNTGTTLADVREAWIELRTRGVRPTEMTMTAVADAAVGAGKTMADTARVFGQLVQGGNIKEGLRDFGIEAKQQAGQLMLTYRYLGKTITETVPQANKLLVANKLTEILTKLRGGAAAEAARGWQGLLLTMAESWKDFALEVMDKGGVFETLKAQLDAFVQGGKNVNGMSENARSLADVLKEVIVIGFRFAAFVRDNLPIAIGYAKDFTAAVGGWKVVLAGVVAFLAAPFIASLIPIVGALWALGTTIVTIIIPSLFALVVAIGGSVIPIIYALGAALLTTPVGWILMAIAAVIAGAWLLYENWDAVVAALGAVWDWIKVQAAAFWQALQGDVAQVANAFVASWEAVRSFFATLWADIKAGFDATFGAIARGIAEVRGWLPSLGSVKLPTVAGVSSSIGNAARNLVDGVLKVEIDVRGDADAKISQARMKGPIDLDPSLGVTMVSP